MRRLKLYLETSVWNFLFADDAPEKKRATERLFQEIEEGKYEIFISETVNAEIKNAPEAKRNMLYGIIEKHKPILLESDEEVRELAEMYIQNGLLTRKHIRDLLHLAYASVEGVHALVSWNLAHLVKMRTQDLGNVTNRTNGYHDIQIRTPQEVIEDERD